jgi:farnesyl-diphosphate farnesyltransferase
VSRTFALNIRYLSGEIHRAVLDAYLICRILDTVEDAPNRDASWKAPLLRSFPGFLRRVPTAEAVEAWSARAREAEMSPAEKELLVRCDAVLSVFHSLSPETRDAMVDPIERMAEGMAATVERGGVGGFQLADTADLERYCYYVAGTVGELLTGLFVRKVASKPRREAMQREQVAFGLGLQLTNILKDIRADRRRAWCYIPAEALRREGLDLETFWSWREGAKNRRALTPLMKLTSDSLRRALAYTLAIPPLQLRLRLFCAVPLMLAMETLALLAPQLGNSDARVKISRSQVRSVLLRAPLACLFSPYLSRWFAARFAAIHAAMENP